MSQRMVMITNMVNGLVSIKDYTYNVNRRWDKRGQTLPIAFEAVEGLLWQSGFRKMIESGVLYINNLQDKKDLGLEPQEVDQPVNIIALTELQMQNLLKNVPLSVFKKEIENLPRVQVDNLIEYAVQNKIVDMDKCEYLHRVTGKDIITAIKAKEEDKKADERERRRKEAYNREEGRRI